MASHGRGAVGRLIHGSVADRVAREATVPTMVVRAGRVAPGPVGITRLVVPLDGSPLAEQSLPVATAISRRLGTPLYLVRAINPRSGCMPPGSRDRRSDPPRDLRRSREGRWSRKRETYLDGVAQTLREQGLPVATEVLNRRRRRPRSWRRPSSATSSFSAPTSEPGSCAGCWGVSPRRSRAKTKPRSSWCRRQSQSPQRQSDWTGGRRADGGGTVRGQGRRW